MDDDELYRQARCQVCEWTGIPTLLRGVPQPECPTPGCKGTILISVEMTIEKALAMMGKEAMPEPAPGQPQPTKLVITLDPTKIRVRREGDDLDD